MNLKSQKILGNWKQSKFETIGKFLEIEQKNFDSAILGRTKTNFWKNTVKFNCLTWSW